MSYRAEKSTVKGRTLYVLQDTESGASATILPEYGFNLFDLRLPLGGQARRVVDAAEDWAENPRQAGGNGIPILFPFPNRIRDGRFTFGGKTYQLPANNGPNAIHGFAIQAAWNVVEAKADEAGAQITGRYQISRQSPEMLEHWPADAILEVRYTLASGRLTLDGTVTNPTGQDLPYGFGIHPYFRIPFAPDGDRARTKVVIPAAQFWVLEAFLPTGERRPVDRRLDFREGQPNLGLKLDDVLTDIPERAVCRLVDETLGAEFRMIVSRPFRELVVYTPPGRPGVISIEPYTQTTDAINLASRGLDAGLRVLRHGASETFRIVMETAR